MDKKSGMGFNNPLDNKIAEIFRRQKELEAQNADKEDAGIETKAPRIIPTQQIAESNESAKLPVGYVGLTGISIKEDGVMTKDNFIQKLAVDHSKYEDIVLTERDVARIKHSLKRMTSGVNAAVPMTCTGDMCAFKNSCVYYELDKAPLGRPCLVESQLIEYWTHQYIEEFDVDATKITELHLISELAELDIYELRVTKYLAENHPTLLQDYVAGIDQMGNVISNLDVSRAFDLKERLKRQRMKVLESLMATRKERVKAIVGVSSGTDTATKIAELKEKIESLGRDIASNTIYDSVAVEIET